METKGQQRQFQRELLQRLRKIMHPYYARIFYILNSRKLTPHALKGQKLLAQGIALGYYGRNTVAL